MESQEQVQIWIQPLVDGSVMIAGSIKAEGEVIVELKNIVSCVPPW